MLAIDPPDATRVRLAHPGRLDAATLDPARQSEVEVTFTEVGPTAPGSASSTATSSVTRGADGLRQGVSGEGGWTLLLGRFSDVVEGRTPRPVPTPAG